MLKHAHKIAAICYLLWGLLHVLGGGLLLSASGNGIDEFLQAQTGTEGLVLAQAGSSAINEPAAAITQSVFSYHSFNIIWIGLVVSTVALFLNWKNSTTGFWINLLLVGFTDLGLVIFLIRPGILTFGQGSPGLLLFLIASVFAILARMTPDNSQRVAFATAAARD